MSIILDMYAIWMDVPYKICFTKCYALLNVTVRVVSASRLDRCYPNPELRSQISDSDHSIRSPSNLLPLSYSYCSLDPTSPFNHLFLRLFL